MNWQIICLYKLSSAINHQISTLFNLFECPYMVKLFGNVASMIELQTGMETRENIGNFKVFVFTQKV